MQNFCFILVVLGLFGVVVIATTQDCRFPGIVGCRFNDEICLEDEECIDDRLFGNCQKVDSVKNFYSYALTISQLQQLEEEVRHLVKEEYEWQDLYTQCVLTSMLLSFRCHRPYDRSLCNGEALAGGAAVAEAPAGDNSGEELSLKEKAARLLQMYLKDYYDDLQAPAVVEPDVDTLDFDDGRDDRVIIHKYKKARKRIVSEELNDEDYANLEALLELSPSELQQLSDYLDEQEGRVASLESSENDLQRNGNSQELFNSREEGSDEVQSNDNDDDDDTSLRFPVPSDRDSLEKIFQTDSEENMNWSSLPEDDARSEHLETEDMETTPEDVRVLKQLLKGEKDVSSIERSQGKRLERLIMEMIADLKLPSTTSSSSSSSESVIDTKTAEVKNVPSEVLQQTAEGMSEPVIAEEDNEEIVKKAQPSNVAINKPEAITTAPSVEPGRYKLLDTRYGYLTLEPTPVSNEDAEKVMAEISSLLKLNPSALTDLSVKGNELQFGVAENLQGLNASQVVYLASSLSDDIYNKTGYRVQSAGIGRDVVDEVKVTIYEPNKKRQYLLVTFVLCAVVVSAVIIVLIVYIVRYHAHSKKKLAQLAESGDPAEASKDLQDLCRQRMLSKSSEKPEPLNAAIAAIQRASSSSDAAMKSPSSRGSTSSWSEEPVTSSMDITTGHIVLSYMEDHLQDKERLNREWEALSAYEAEPNDTSEAISPANLSKNRYSDILPYDHSRVVLNRSANASGSDYINASFITDHDPRNPAYIVTQGPLFNTIADFWQMVWEQGSVVIVNLTKLSEGGRTMCHRYWPEEGSEVYHSYEVHLVSEHIWCDDYLVRSFYLKNLLTGETRTVTQFHYLTWHDLSVPNSVKTLLDFRRKVNKSYRGRSCPIIVHCSDGAGRTGTYCLVDLVLNRMNKGAKEIDMAASLEHIRDQRMCLVKSKEQFEFALAAVAEEVHAILKALPQQ